MIEQRGNEIVVQSFDVERENGKTWLVGWAVEVDARALREPFDRLFGRARSRGPR